MKKLVVIIALLIGSNIYSQTEETNRGTVKYLLNQINSLNFKELKPTQSYAFVGTSNGVSVYWIRIVETNTITYHQVMRQFDKSAEGHTIITDLDGNNARGTHEVQLKYK